MMSRNLYSLQFTIEKKERIKLRQELVCMNHKETSHLSQFHRMQILLLNASKEPITKFSRGTNAISKSWNVSLLEIMDRPCFLIMKLLTQSGVQVTRFQVFAINNIFVEAASDRNKCP